MKRYYCWECERGAFVTYDDAIALAKRVAIETANWYNRAIPDATAALLVAQAEQEVGKEVKL